MSIELSKLKGSKSKRCEVWNLNYIPTFISCLMINKAIDHVGYV